MATASGTTGTAQGAARKASGRFQSLCNFSRRVGKLIRKPNHWFTLLGAAVVFMTFVAKEGVRDRLKDTIGSFESAQRAFELRDQNRNLLTMMTDVRSRIVGIEERLSPAKVRVNNNIPYWSDSVESVRKELQLTEQLLGNLASLNGNLPRDKERDSAEAECKRLAAETTGIYLSAVKAITDVTDRIKVANRRLKREEELSIQASVLRYINAQTNVALKVASFGTNVLQEAPKYLEEKERGYSRWTVASYFLYVLGWGLALLGKVYGVELANGEA